ncbi:hypothetical protein BKA70DRAFT_1328955 [Coprinopsis sp. MPI-PUGE-AT-0042]|nr:hypothetical protein BKA70DRAFT_1328955 [Coprinopsis sp. MPI-PUGE-AT-0042]
MPGNKDNKEQSFHILPHPAKSNNPSDLQPQSGLSDGPVQAFHARDPHVPSEEIRNNMPKASSREELQKRQAQLNADK